MQANIDAGLARIRGALARVPVEVVCALIALAVAVVAVAPILGANQWNLTALVYMAESDALAPLAREIDPSFVLVPVHYDGIYFYAIALDPLAQGPPHLLVDLAANRYGHPAYGWAARVLALSRAELIPLGLLLAGVGGLVTGAAGASRLWRVLGGTPWGGLTVALNPGLVYAVTVDTSEAFAAGVLMLALLAWATRRFAIAAVLLIVLCFSKEILALVPIGLGIWETAQLVRRRIDRRTWLRRAALLGIGPLLYAGWYVYVRERFGRFPIQDFDPGLPGITTPIQGWIDSLQLGAQLRAGGFMDAQVGHVVVPLVAVGFVAILIGVVQALRFRNLLDPVYLLVAGLSLSLAWPAMMFPKEFIRNLSFTFLLLAAVLLIPRRADKSNGEIGPGAARAAAPGQSPPEPGAREEA